MNLKEFTSTKKGQLILCCSLLALVWLVILLNILGDKFDEIPNQAKIAKARQELFRLEREYEKISADYSKNNAVKKEYRTLAGNAWINSHDGSVETTLRHSRIPCRAAPDFTGSPLLRCFCSSPMTLSGISTCRPCFCKAGKSRWIIQPH